MSQVEDAYFKSENSSPKIETSGNTTSAMARMESSSHPPSAYTGSPLSDDGMGSMAKFATLPSPKGKGKKANKVDRCKMAKDYC